ncbi:MAG: hypothetical protein CMJ46_00425 [Planctomyces sp.]|nr:hypothetical protein [Planctomyces sp.]
MCTLFAFILAGILWTPNQQAQRHFRDKEYARSAEEFQEPEWQGAAWYRAGEFEKAAQAFARSKTPEARYNEGNAWVLLGKYDIAVDRYEKALQQRPDWKEARENRDLAAARAKMLDNSGGDAGDQKLGADKIVFDKKKQEGGEDTEVTGAEASSDATMQALWLRRVQTKPADFLRSKFAYQLSMEPEGENQ